jgi:hypothetical protein
MLPQRAVPTALWERNAIINMNVANVREALPRSLTTIQALPQEVRALFAFALNA